MMSALLAAAALAVLAGLGAIAYGIPFKEFSVGSTLIQSGTLGVCSGLILFGLAAVLSELKVMSGRLRQRMAPESDIRALQLPGPGKTALSPPRDRRPRTPGARAARRGRGPACRTCRHHCPQDCRRRLRCRPRCAPPSRSRRAG